MKWLDCECGKHLARVKDAVIEIKCRNSKCGKVQTIGYAPKYKIFDKVIYKGKEVYINEIRISFDGIEYTLIERIDGKYNFIRDYIKEDDLNKA